MEKLGIHDIAGLVRYAMRAGLIPPVDFLADKAADLTDL